MQSKFDLFLAVILNAHKGVLKKMEGKKKCFLFQIKLSHFLNLSYGCSDFELLLVVADLSCGLLATPLQWVF